MSGAVMLKPLINSLQKDLSLLLQVVWKRVVGVLVGIVDREAVYRAVFGQVPIWQTDLLTAAAMEM